MTNHRPSSIRLEASNYGPIVDAKVDLRPLTVFVGPSNTGKSYLAILIYALHRFFGRVSPLSPEMLADYPLFHGSIFRQYIEQPDDNIDILSSWQMFEDWFVQLSSLTEDANTLVKLPEDLADIIRPHLHPAEDWNEMMRRELARCFGREDPYWLIRHGQDLEAKFSIASSDELEHSSTWKYEFTLTRDKLYTTHSMAESAALSLDSASIGFLMKFAALPDSRKFGDDDPHMWKRIWRTLVADLTGSVGTTMVGPLSHRAHYLPADRTGVMHSHQTIVASMVSRAPLAGLGPDLSIPNLSGVLADFLVQLLSLGSQRPHRTTDQEPGVEKTIEDRILSGAIQTDRSDANYPSFSFQPYGWKAQLPLMNSSSMVSEIAPIVLYLRQVVSIGDVLIIEEPESHLHPAMQVEFVRQLAAVVKSGVRIILTTHSEWVLEALANLVHLSDVEDAKRTEALKEEPALGREEVGVWLFEQQPDRLSSRVKELPLDVDLGGFASGYDRIARQTYNRWADIENLLHGE